MNQVFLFKQTLKEITYCWATFYFSYLSDHDFRLLFHLLSSVSICLNRNNLQCFGGSFSIGCEAWNEAAFGYQSQFSPRFNSQFSADFHWEFWVVENQVITFITGKSGVLSERFQVENWRRVNYKRNNCIFKRIPAIIVAIFCDCAILSVDLPLVKKYRKETSLTMISGTFYMCKLLTIIWSITAVTSIVLWSSSCRGNKHATTTAARLPKVWLLWILVILSNHISFTSIYYGCRWWISCKRTFVI